MRDRVPRTVIALSSVAVFLAAASWSHLSARAQVPSLPLARPVPLLAPRLPAGATLVAPPMISIGDRVTAGQNMYLTTRNVGPTANGRRVRMVKSSNGAAIFLTVSSWTADRITAAVPAMPFGAFDRAFPVLIGLWDGARWVAGPQETWVMMGGTSRGARPAGCATADWDRDGNEAIECGGSDCDDSDSARSPGQPEVCDAQNHDEDCDGSTFGERDADGDDSFDARCCNLDGAGGRSCGNDCDDYRADAHPGTSEACDMRDNDCDGVVDEGVMHTLWADRDADGFGDPAQPRSACGWSTGLSYVPNDCNDGDRRVFMGHGCE